LNFRKYTLDNGLQIIAEENPKAYSMAVGFFVDAGSRDESDQTAGVSHFLEHMAFKGTDRLTALEINREMDAIGSQSNAYTSEEQTVYYMAVVPDYQVRAIELLAQLMRPALRQQDFDVEKQVIIEEIMKYDDQPPFGAHEKGMASFFGDHPLGRSVLGTVETVGALTVEQMRAYFESRYGPNNMTLVATGNVDFEQTVRQAERLCGRWMRSAATRDFPQPGSKHENAWIHRANASQQYAIQIAGGPPADAESRYAHRLMSNIFGDEGSSRLFWEFVDTGLAEYASTSAYEFQGAGITMTFLGCDPEDVADNLKRLRDLQLDIQISGVSEEEVELAISKLSSQIVRRAERPINRLFAVGLNWLQRGAYQTVRQAVDSYQRLTSDDVAASLAQHPLTDCSTVLAGPVEQQPARAT
jgi:predicted Zn-dependent peptidase